jgi:hypothetical protein
LPIAETILFSEFSLTCSCYANGVRLECNSHAIVLP